ncbi:MAG TPA: hypothetical protein VHE61_00740 [Opitutaceae bacterium]|nr:hypothetical protein [Opitutaceae bacterium]
MNVSFRPLFLLVAGWGLAAALALAFNLPRHTAPGVVPALVLLAAAALVVGLGRSETLRAPIRAVPTRALLAFNALRFVGGAFLWYAAQGQVPTLFADRAGWGDIATAAGALALLGWRGAPDWALWLWNSFGLLDLIVAVGTAGWLTFARPDSMVALTHFPLGLIPLWAVPMMLAVHAEVFRRLRATSDHATTAAVGARG